MKLLNEIKSMLLSEDEQTVVLGIRLLLNVDPEIIKREKCPDKLQGSLLGNYNVYYDILYDFEIYKSPVWNIIKYFPLNEKFCMNSIQEELLMWGLYDGSSN